MLVKIFTRSKAEDKAAGHHGGRRRSRLGNDAGMYSYARTSHRRAEQQVLGPMCDRADHRPDKRALPLRIGPRVKVIGNHREAESAFLCSHCLGDQLIGRCSSLDSL